MLSNFAAAVRRPSANLLTLALALDLWTLHSTRRKTRNGRRGQRRRGRGRRRGPRGSVVVVVELEGSAETPLDHRRGGDRHGGAEAAAGAAGQTVRKIML